MSQGNNDPAFPLSHVSFLSTPILHEPLIQLKAEQYGLSLRINLSKRQMLVHVLSFAAISRCLSEVGRWYSLTGNLMDKCHKVGTKLSSHRTGVYVIRSLSFSFTS